MKQKCFLIVLLLITCNFYGQIEKDFRLGFGFQWNIPKRYFNTKVSEFSGENSGIGFHMYPDWFYKENMSLGVDFEISLVEEKPLTDDISVFIIISAVPMVNYYFTKGNICPYVGLGTGVYYVSNVNNNFSLGVKPIVGVSVYNNFNVSIEYNRIITDLGINPLNSVGFGNYYIALKGTYTIKLFNTN